MKTLFEHSFDESLMTPNGYVLDAGCGVDFWFSKSVLNMGMRVISIDPNPAIISIPDNKNLFFERMALSVQSNSSNILYTYTNIDAATVINSNSDSMRRLVTGETETKTISIIDLMKKYNVEQFDLIKMDIEGSEYSILMDIDRPISKQISIEFHDFRNLNPYFPNNEKYYEKLMEHLGNIYDLYDDICKKPGWMNKHERHWDVLLRIKK